MHESISACGRIWDAASAAYEHGPEVHGSHQGRPLLEWWFELLRSHGVSEVLVNTHYLPEPVRGISSTGTGRTGG